MKRKKDYFGVGEMLELYEEDASEDIRNVTLEEIREMIQLIDEIMAGNAHDLGEFELSLEEIYSSEPGNIFEVIDSKILEWRVNRVYAKVADEQNLLLAYKERFKKIEKRLEVIAFF